MYIYVQCSLFNLNPELSSLYSAISSRYYTFCLHIEIIPIVQTNTMAGGASVTHAEDGIGIAIAASHLEGDTVGISDEILLKMSKNIDNFGEITENAQAATDFEHQMTVGQALRLYPKAIAFSVVLSLAIIMEGYDTALLGSFYGYPAFQERFGVRLQNGSYQVTAPWQSGLQSGAQVGEILGLMIAGMLAERFGYKKTMLGALLMITGAIFLLFFAQNISMLMAGEILCGIPWGAFQVKPIQSYSSVVFH
jgi:SP family general alpha glucoside:H+ symporter-like MFS transporter